LADDLFEHPRLAAIYDALESDRGDLDVYAAIADELGARRVLDVGCGTGTFALLLSSRGLEVTGVDPAEGSLDVARAKPSSERVTWLHGDATALPPMQVDLATMTGNVAQAIVDPPTGTARCVASMTRCSLGGISCSKPVIQRTAPGSSGTARPLMRSPRLAVSALSKRGVT